MADDGRRAAGLILYGAALFLVDALCLRALVVTPVALFVALLHGLIRVAEAIAQRRVDWIRGRLTPLAVTAYCVVFNLAWLRVDDRLAQRDDRLTQRRAEQIIDAVYGYRARNGHYPPSLQGVVPWPQLLENRIEYVLPIGGSPNLNLTPTRRSWPRIFHFGFDCWDDRCGSFRTMGRGAPP